MMPMLGVRCLPHDLLVSVDRIIQSGTNGGAVLRILGDVETDVVELLQSREDFLALGQERQVADEYEVTDITA